MSFNILFQGGQPRPRQEGSRLEADDAAHPRGAALRLTDMPRAPEQGAIHKLRSLNVTSFVIYFHESHGCNIWLTPPPFPRSGLSSTTF